MVTYGRKADDYRGRYFRQMGLVLLTILLLAVLPLTFFDDEMRNLYISEGGPIQVFSAAGYLVVMATLVRELPTKYLLKHWYFLAIPIAMCLRELDFHAHLTTYSITKTTFYISPDVALPEKLAAVSVFAILGLSAYRLVTENFRDFMRGLARYNASAVAIIAALGCAVLSKTLDGAASNLDVFGIHVTPNYASVVIEEVLELGIPMFMSIAAFAAFPAQDTRFAEL